MPRRHFSDTWLGVSEIRIDRRRRLRTDLINYTQSNERPDIVGRALDEFVLFHPLSAEYLTNHLEKSQIRIASDSLAERAKSPFGENTSARTRPPRSFSRFSILPVVVFNNTMAPD